MPLTHRPLLPKPISKEEAAPRGRRRRHNTSNACDSCREKKTKCDGQHPTCSKCLELGAFCTYSVAVLRRSRGAEADRGDLILELLRTLPHEQATSLLRTIRNDGPDPQGRTYTLSEHELLRSQLAPTKNNLEFELMMRHPASYPPMFPLQVTSLPLESLLRPSRISAPQAGLDSSSSEADTKATVQYFPTRPLVDKRLRSLEMKTWSDVPISNDLAAHVISLFIETDYQTLPLFHLHLFLQDLIRGRPNFCSRLLVNSLLSWACVSKSQSTASICTIYNNPELLFNQPMQQSYTAIDPEAHSFGLRFFSEAQELITDGPELITLTSVSALVFLCISALGYGRDRLALRLLRQGIAIGTKMGLWNTTNYHQSANAWLGCHDEWIVCASYTAWGAYNWASLYGLRYHSLEIDIPPRLPMPGTVHAEHARAELESNAPPISTLVFRACCELWTISNDVIRQYHRDNGSGAISYCFEHAEDTFRRLLSWADALPLRLLWNDANTHAVLMMHIWFHAIVADIFRPFLSAGQDPFRLRSFETLQATPQAVYAATVNQLKRLLLVFRLSFKTASLSILSQTVLIYVCNAVVREAQSSELPEWRFYLRLCLAASEDLYASYRESLSVTRGLLTMALERGAIKPDEAARVIKEMMELGQHHDVSGDEDTESMVDLDMAMVNPDAARVTSLAGRFEERMLQKAAG